MQLVCARGIVKHMKKYKLPSEIKARKGRDVLPLSVRIDADLKEWLVDEARGEGVGITDIVEPALTEYRKWVESQRNKASKG